MKKYYTILGQTKKDKLPVCFSGWYKNVKEAEKDFDKDCEYLYGYSENFFEHIKRHYSSKIYYYECSWLEELK